MLVCCAGMVVLWFGGVFVCGFAFGYVGFGACGYLVYLLFVTDCVDFWGVGV